MRFGVIDIGSNSCRLKIEDWANGEKTVCCEALQTTRLMKGVAQTGELAADTMEATLSALRNFQEKLTQYAVQACWIVATSAMREARNGAAFAKTIEQTLHIPVEIISGETEAALSYAGIRAALPHLKKPLMLDVGGGSSEFYCPGIVQLSIKMGAIRAAEENLSSEKAQTALAPLRPFQEALADCTLVGCGGTITTLAAIFHQMKVYRKDIVQGTVLSRAQIQSIHNRLASLSLEERRQVPGLQPTRAETIVPGTFWVLQILQFLEQDFMTVSDADLREGILAQMAGQ